MKKCLLFVFLRRKYEAVVKRVTAAVLSALMFTGMALSVCAKEEAKYTVNIEQSDSGGILKVKEEQAGYSPETR